MNCVFKRRYLVASTTALVAIIERTLMRLAARLFLVGISSRKMVRSALVRTSLLTFKKFGAYGEPREGLDKGRGFRQALEGLGQV